MLLPIIICFWQMPAGAECTLPFASEDAIFSIYVGFITVSSPMFVFAHIRQHKCARKPWRRESIHEEGIHFDFSQHITQDHITKIPGNQQISVCPNTGILLLDLIVHHIGNFQFGIFLNHLCNL